MGWGFRKSFGGAFRVTFSKSGVSTSWGAKGFRVTSGPRGVYVTSGFGGFYYRQRVGGGQRARTPGARSPPAYAPGTTPTETISSADVGVLSDIGQEEFLRSLNEWTHRGAIQLLYLAGSIAALAVMSDLEAWLPYRIEIGCYLVIGFLLARSAENRRRRFLLVYDLSDHAARKFEAMCVALEAFAHSGRLRSVRLTQQVSDWKRNSGATGAFGFENARLQRTPPPHIVSNIAPWMLVTQGKAIWFFPDRMLIRQGTQFAALAYDAVAIHSDTGQFIWTESLPRDAQVVGRTWRFVRRDGGPDRRFANNYQIPIVLIGYVALESATGLKLLLQSTNLPAVEVVARELGARTEMPRRSPTTTAREFDSEVAAALAVFGLGELPARETLQSAFHGLAKRNHPDRFSNAAPEIRAMVEERMKEVNVAYAILRRQLPATGSVEERSIPASATRLAPMRLPGAFGFAPTLAAVVACCLVFWASRVGAMNWSAAPEKTATTRQTDRDEHAVATQHPSNAPPLLLPRACVLRSAASTDSAQVAVLDPRAQVTPTGTEIDGWKKVTLESGQAGWLGPRCWVAPFRDGAPCRTDTDCQSGLCSIADGEDAFRCVAREAAQPQPERRLLNIDEG